ncbi:hypothetical protein RhiJN_16463 [Ceratobasidium sp. AG-Ba]|nr:hypothetical protein RhiJN_16463 [Ceratobasidium sp. AG-Ba]
MQFVGRIEGEGCERAWAYLNEMAGSTSEMSPGFWRDTIAYIMADWNYGKMIGIAIFLSTKYKEGLKGFAFQRKKFAEVDGCITNEQRREWNALPLEAREDPPGSGIWRSVFSTPSASGKLQELAIRKHEEESESSRTPAKKLGVARWLISGLELESEQRRTQDLRKTITKLSTQRQKEEFDAKQKALNERILLFREERDKYMGDCGEPDHPELKLTEATSPDDAQLGLPSSYLPQTMQEANLHRLVELEADIRRADCHDTLDRVRELLGAKALMLKLKKANVRGEVPTTRAESKLRAHTEKVQKERWRYNNSRDALIRLGATDGDLKIYKRLEDHDLRYLKDYSENESRGLGQGHVSPPWIWTGRSELFKDEKTWLGQTLKVEWFRTRERYKRWEEELKLLKREMVMSYRSFKTFQDIWEFKGQRTANSTPEIPGMAEYAYAKSEFFRQLAEGVMVTCLPHIKDDTVTLKWCSDWLSRDSVSSANPDGMEFCGMADLVLIIYSYVQCDQYLLSYTFATLRLDPVVGITTSTEYAPETRVRILRLYLPELPGIEGLVFGSASAGGDCQREMVSFQSVNPNKPSTVKYKPTREPRISVLEHRMDPSFCQNTPARQVLHPPAEKNLADFPSTEEEMETGESESESEHGETGTGNYNHSVPRSSKASSSRLHNLPGVPASSRRIASRRNPFASASPNRSRPSPKTFALLTGRSPSAAKPSSGRNSG